jgi:hypothetical protein
VAVPAGLGILVWRVVMDRDAGWRDQFNAELERQRKISLAMEAKVAGEQKAAELGREARREALVMETENDDLGEEDYSAEHFVPIMTVDAGDFLDPPRELDPAVEKDNWIMTAWSMLDRWPWYVKDDVEYWFIRQMLDKFRSGAKPSGKQMDWFARIYQKTKLLRLKEPKKREWEDATLIEEGARG